MSMVSYAAGTRYLSLIGGTCLSFMTGTAICPRLADDRGEQTDVPESADWYNSSYIIAGLQRAADPNPGRPLLYRSALQGHQNYRHHAGLFGSR